MNSALRFEQLLEELASQCRLDLRGYKFSTLHRRTRRRMEQLRIGSYAAYLEFIRENPKEVNELLNTVLINVTRFFRDPVAWDWMRDHGIPLLLDQHRMGESFKVWCAGCSTGEEAYSIVMLLALHLGEQIHSHDIKIYATDQDEHALNLARRAEYNSAALNHLPPEMRERFFTGKDKVRFDRNLRRLVIFGRSNLISDAPISHVNLLVCRNVLIYFDPSAQRHVLNRLQYAVDPKGILFLGKSESQLRDNPYFTALNARWRIFQRTDVPSPLERSRTMTTTTPEQPWNEKSQQELQALKLYHNAILQTLEPGILLVDNDDNVINENESMRRLWEIETRFLGSKLSESSLARKCPELIDLVRQVRERKTTLQMDCPVGDHRHLAVTVRPVTEDGRAEIVGVLIYAEDISPEQNLQHTIEELQTTAEELQSSNEELETTNEELQSTNEELQSTNEELETTNEELQSTNEELETTNEELKSLNEELEDINEELAKRSKELDELNARYSEMVEGMPWPMLLANKDGYISVYNTAAQELFGFATPSAKGMSLQQLPMSASSRSALIKRFRQAMAKKRASHLEGMDLVTNSDSYIVNIRINPLSPVGNDHGLLIMFENMGRAPSPAPSRSVRTSTNSGHSSRKQLAKKNPAKKKAKSKSASKASGRR